jgi:uncharacterized protein (DUF433 family)
LEENKYKDITAEDIEEALKFLDSSEMNTLDENNL